METVELKPGIYWVGAVDWNVRDFHGYSTPFGTTYNAYLILDEKNVLVDTVTGSFGGGTLAASFRLMQTGARGGRGERSLSSMIRCGAVRRA